MISTQKSRNKLLLPEVFSSNGFQIAKNSTKRVFPQMAPTDDAEKITSEPHGPYVLLTRTCTTQKLKTLRGVPVQYRPNTLRQSSQKNLLFTTLEYQSWGELCLPWFVRVLVFLQQQGLIPFSWSRSLFLIGVFLGVFCRILSIQESLLGVSQNVEGKSFPYTRKRDWQAIFD